MCAQHGARAKMMTLPVPRTNDMATEAACARSLFLVSTASSEVVLQDLNTSSLSSGHASHAEKDGTSGVLETVSLASLAKQIVSCPM